MIKETLAGSHRSAGTGESLALWFGLATALVSLTTAMAQFERGANRIYGLERDRPFKRKYGRALPHLPDPVALAPGASFPSGHTVNAMLGAGVLLLLALPVLRGIGKILVVIFRASSASSASPCSATPCWCDRSQARADARPLVRRLLRRSGW